jgi:hypothetical protein
MIACGGRVADGKTTLAFRREPVARIHPRLMERAIVTVADGSHHGSHLAEIRAPV